ncbi:hypothetical protein BJX63DRAFT_407712 [Aspergillus granulosus]|uniref:Nucleoside phosphorylase domain-containing protein n=1 Tax=Aspergillus granulosus TaxID=176169 RepID=A0ABR4H083_9EURO
MKRPYIALDKDQDLHQVPERETAHLNMSDRTQPDSLRHESYTVGWICALPVEMAAAEAMLDEIHPSLPQDKRDPNCYTLGRIGTHNVVIVCLPAGVTGTISTARVLQQIQSTFKGMRYGIMVGIGGGAPLSKDIRLGDVVVGEPCDTSGEIIQVDFSKTVEDCKFYRMGLLNQPPGVLPTVVPGPRAHHHDNRPLPKVVAPFSSVSGPILPAGFDPSWPTNKVARIERVVPGTLDEVDVDCFPDTGSCINAISLELAKQQGWPIRYRHNLPKVKLPTNRSVRPLGVVTLPWSFSGENTVYDVEFLILPRCVHPVILGRNFLISSQTLDTELLYRRFKKKRVYHTRRNRLCFLGSLFDRTRGTFNGHTAWALADTGSDVMVVSRSYAESHGFDIHTADNYREWLEFADGSMRRADGMVLNAEWSFGKGSLKYRQNFFVLDGIDTDIILSNSFLFENRIFSTHKLFRSQSLGSPTAAFDSGRLNLINLIKERNGCLSQSLGSVRTDDGLDYTDDDELEHLRRADAEDLINTLAEDARIAARTEEDRKRAEWDQRKALLRASAQASKAQNPTHNSQRSTKARRRFRLIFWGKGRQKP